MSRIARSTEKVSNEDTLADRLQNAMDPLKFVTFFSLTDEMSDRLRSVCAATTVFSDRILESGERLHEMGDRMLRWGEQIGGSNAVLSEGAATASLNNLAIDQTGGHSLVGSMQLFRLAGEPALQPVKEVGWRGGELMRTRTSLAELSIVCAANQHIGRAGSSAMMLASAISEMVTKWPEGKSSIYFNHRLVHNPVGIRTEVLEMLNPRKQVGASDSAAMALSLEHLSLVVDKLKQSAGGAGTLSTAYTKAAGNVSDAAARWHRSANQYDTLASPLSAIAGKRVQILPRPKDRQDGALRIMYAFDCIKSFGTSGRTAKGLGFSITKPMGMRLASWTPTVARWTTIGPGEPLGVIGVGIYKHWHAIKKSLVEMPDWMKTVDRQTIRSLGMFANIEWPMKAAEGLPYKIGAYFHSRPAYGLLGDAILNFKPGAVLAQRIKPAPVVNAVSRTPISMAAPAPGASGGVAPISINYAPVINGAGLDEHQILRVLERHAYELYRIIGRQQERRERLAFR